MHARSVRMTYRRDLTTLYIMLSMCTQPWQLLGHVSAAVSAGSSVACSPSWSLLIWHYHLSVWARRNRSLVILLRTIRVSSSFSSALVANGRWFSRACCFLVCSSFASILDSCHHFFCGKSAFASNFRAPISPRGHGAVGAHHPRTYDGPICGELHGC